MKLAIYGGATIGGLIGGYLPVFWGGNLLDITSVVLGTLGTIVGIWAGYKLGKYFGL